MEAGKFLKHWWLIPTVGIFLAACGGSGFNYGRARNIIQGTPLRLDAEYVMLTSTQVTCGVDNDLWDAPNDPGEHGRQTARLKQAARNLGFSDDVSIGDLPRPYAQVRGTFNLAVAEVTSDKDGPQQNTRLVTTKVGVTLQNACFTDPLPLMGVHNGNFSQDFSPVLLFRFDNGWTLDQIAH